MANDTVYTSFFVAEYSVRISEGLAGFYAVFPFFLFKGEFTSMGVYSSGNSYGVPEDLIYSFPVQIQVSLIVFWGGVNLKFVEI